MRKRVLAVAAMFVVVSALLAAGCGGDTSGNQQGSTDGGSAGGGAGGGETGTGETSGSGQGGQTAGESTSGETSGEQVSVGGYTLGGGGLPETRVPEVTVDQAAAERYLDGVRPVVQDTASDVSGAIDAEPRIEGGNLTLDVDLDSLETARDSARQGLQELQDIQTPEGLDPINQQLVSAYEDVIPAYNDVLEAAQNGDTEQTLSAIENNLPRIEGFNEGVDAITQDLDQATGEQ